MSTGKIILSVVTGIAIGATVGVMFAPEKGSLTRKKIFKKSNKYVDKLEKEFYEFIDSITKEYEELREEAIRMGEVIDYEEEAEDERFKTEY